MYLIPQGANPQVKIRELEARVDALEKTLQALQYSDKPKPGRPPKVKDEQTQDVRDL